MKGFVPLGLALAWPWLLGQAPEPGVLERYAAEGQRALSERRWGDAARAYEKLRELAPDTAEVHAQLGTIYIQQRDYARAASALRQALELKADLSGADILLAVCLSELGRHKEALPGLQKGFRQTSDATRRRATGLQLLRSYAGLGREDEAAEVALLLARLYPKDPEVLYHTARSISNHAYLLTLRLAEVGRQSVWMHLAAGEANESLGNYDAAVDEYRAALTLQPARLGLHYRIGRVFLARARPPRSEEHAEAAAEHEFEQELRIDPTNADAASELGELRRKAGDLDRARELFESAVEHYPEFGRARVGLGQVLIAQRRPDLALPHLQKAIALQPDDDVAFFQLSEAYGAIGRAEEARRARAEFQRLRTRKREQERLGLLRQQ